MLLYTLTKKIIEVQKNMLNAFGIILFYKWCDGLMVKTLVWSQRDQGSIPITNMYYVEYVYWHIYLVHMCKYIVLRWIVDR